MSCIRGLRGEIEGDREGGEGSGGWKWGGGRGMGWNMKERWRGVGVDVEQEAGNESYYLSVTEDGLYPL